MARCRQTHENSLENGFSERVLFLYTMLRRAAPVVYEGSIHKKIHGYFYNFLFHKKHQALLRKITLFPKGPDMAGYEKTTLEQFTFESILSRIGKYINYEQILLK